MGGERSLRAAVHSRLLFRARSSADTLVIDELGVLNGLSRIDIAVVNGHIRGIELKSSDDTLDRLQKQISSYGTIVDTATLVVAERMADEAIKMLPEWWGVIKVSRTGKMGYHFLRLRKDRINPAPNALDIARLLWRAEAALLLERLTTTRASSRRTRFELYEVLAKELPLKILQTEVRDVLKNRVNWRDRELPLSDGG
jgi:hypothetical protein